MYASSGEKFEDNTAGNPSYHVFFFIHPYIYNSQFDQIIDGSTVEVHNGSKILKFSVQSAEKCLYS